MPPRTRTGATSPGGSDDELPTAAQFMQFMQQQQRQTAAQNANIERMINAFTNATSATTATPATAALPETKPTAHGDHHPPKSERADFMRNEKVLVEHLSAKRLERPTMNLWIIRLRNWVL